MGWWSNKLGHQPTEAPAPTWTPQPPHQWQPVGHTQQQPQQYAQPQQPQQQEQYFVLGGVAIPASKAAAGNPKGAARHERDNCPECGDPRYFNRDHRKLLKLNTKTGQKVAPAPICEACGYNGLFEQYGNQVAMTETE